MKRQILKTAMGAMLFATVAINTSAQKERSEIDDKFKWNVYDLYQSDEAWNQTKAELVRKSEQIVTFKGTLGTSAQNLLKYLKFNEELMKEASRLSLYASLKADSDLRDADNQARQKELSMFFVDYGQKASFVSPELAAIPQPTMEQFIASEPGLAPYKMGLDRIYRMKAHTLSPAEEALMAKTGLITGTGSSVFEVFSDAEMPWPTITLTDGSKVELTKQAFGELRSSSNRANREIAFKAFWDQYKKFEGSFGEMLNGEIKEHVFRAKARNYASALEAATKPNNIPMEVYHSLVENVNANLPTFHRYLELKKRMMGLDTLKYSDMYASTVKGVELTYNYDQAQALILESLKPLGKEYTDVVAHAFKNRWIDVYPNKGKRSGAYSNGAAYDVHPYILMNFNNQYNEVSTLTHELGHTMHSYFSNKTQPYATSRYVTFVAEVASTFNEALLNDMMQKKIKDKDQKMALLMSMLDGFKGTLFRQTQFAEFELRIHEAAEAGTPLTGKALSKIYGDIARKYYGHDKGVCLIDSNVDAEWAYIPHFYMNFYVYQYSTSFVASQALAAKVLAGEKGAKERYMKFISAGGSDYPINLLKNAGVDMTSPEPFKATIATMNKIMDEIELLLKK